MAQELKTLDHDTISKLVIGGDLKGLTEKQRVEYYTYRCQQVGLDPSAQPFALLTLNGKLLLYALAGCAQQLTSLHKLSHLITSRELVDGTYCVFCRVSGPDGRSTENLGAVAIEGLKGEAKANAMMKATTKAIRRSVLAHMGLGMMDETEVETIPGAKTAPQVITNHKDTITPATPMSPQVCKTISAMDHIDSCGWTDADRVAAKDALLGTCDMFAEHDVPSAVISKIADEASKKIGDQETTPSQWMNRLMVKAESTCKKYQRVEEETA